MHTDSVSGAITHIFRIWQVLLDTTWGRSLGRYDDGLQKVANGFTDLKRDEEVLERLEKPVGAALVHCFRGKVVGSNPAGPTNSLFHEIKRIRMSILTDNLRWARVPFFLILRVLIFLADFSMKTRAIEPDGLP
jgi:hypothetical protein